MKRPRTKSRMSGIGADIIGTLFSASAALAGRNMRKTLYALAPSRSYIAYDRFSRFPSRQLRRDTRELGLETFQIPVPRPVYPFLVTDLSIDLNVLIKSVARIVSAERTFPRLEVGRHFSHPEYSEGTIHLAFAEHRARSLRNGTFLLSLFLDIRLMTVRQRAAKLQAVSGAERDLPSRFGSHGLRPFAKLIASNSERRASATAKCNFEVTSAGNKSRS